MPRAFQLMRIMVGNRRNAAACSSMSPRVLVASLLVVGTWGSADAWAESRPSAKPVEVAAQFVRVSTPDYQPATSSHSLASRAVNNEAVGVVAPSSEASSLSGLQADTKETSESFESVDGDFDHSREDRVFTPALGTYTFKVGWQGIPAATLTLSTEQRGLHYKISATAKTYSGIDIFYKLRYRAEGLVSALDFSPVRSSFYSQENSKERLTEISFLEDREVHTVRSGSNRKTEVLQFDPENNMLEPFSAAFLARSLDWNIGDSRSFDTFNGKTRYLITLECTGRDTIEVNGEDRDVWVIEPKVRNLTNQKENSKLRQAFIYLSADDRREVLKVKSEVFIGSVSAWLDSFEPAPNFPSTFMAKAEDRSAPRVVK